MLEIIDIHKTYEGQPLLHGISFTVQEGEAVCLLGPSGSGKSTLLRMIAGLEPSDSGQILWDGRDLAGVPPHLRDFGLVFQDYALFPHLDVFDNVAFGLKMKNMPLEAIKTRVSEVMDLVNLIGFENRKVTDLSGGEQQRVALARALAPRPRLLMFDEPLGALDRTLREDLLAELRDILHQTGIPAVYVTHDQEEASTIAGRILLLHAGEIVREGTPAEVWAQPDSAWAARFLGLGNVIEGTCRLKDEGLKVETAYGVYDLSCKHKHQNGDKINVLVRPTATHSGETLQGVVTDVFFQQDKFRVVLEHGLYSYFPEAPEIGKTVSIRIKMECLGTNSDSQSASL